MVRQDTLEPSSKIRLLKFMGIFAIGGTERQVVNLVRQLDFSKFDLRFGCFKRSGQFLNEVEALGIPIFEYKISSLCHYRTIREQIRLARLLRSERIQLVHTYGFYPTVFAIPAAKLAGVPVTIASIRDTGELLTPLQRKTLKLACHMADSILVNAGAVREWLTSEGYRASKIEVIRNGIDLDRFEQTRYRSGIRKELGVDDGVPLVAMLARLNRLKGIEYFIEAAGEVARRFPQVRFLVVGDVRSTEIPYKESLRRRADALGLADRLIFTGFRVDVPQLLSEIAISVLPSLSEGLSNALLESMAAGVPTIATRVGGNLEIVQDGVTGLLVPPRDSKALAHALTTLLEQPALARQFGEAGQARVNEHFHLTKMVRQTEQHYLKLLQQSDHKLRRVSEVAA